MLKLTPLSESFQTDDSDPSFSPAHLKVLVVSGDRECLKECCQTLSECQVQVDAAVSTLSGARLIAARQYHVLIVDTQDVDWHHLQVCAAIHGIQSGRAMPVVAVLQREETEFAHQWGDGNDFDEQLSWPLIKSEVMGFIKGCANYCQMSAAVS